MTTKTTKTDSEIIDALGGPAVLADVCQVVPQAISIWRTKGIPLGWRRYLEMAYPTACGLTKAPKPPVLRARLRRVSTPAAASASA
jgi:hypothetical protein